MFKKIMDIIEYNEGTQALGFITATIITVLFAMVIICVPIAWFDGHAKSAYLKQTQNLEIPWHQATFLTVETNHINMNSIPEVNVKITK